MAINMWIKTFFFFNPTWPAETIGFGCTTSFQAYWKKFSTAADENLFTAFCNHSERARATAGAGEEIRERHRGQTRRTVCFTLQLFPRPASARAQPAARLDIRQQSSYWSNNESSDWPSLYRPDQSEHPLWHVHWKVSFVSLESMKKIKFKTSRLYLMSLRSSGCIEAYDSQWEEVHALLASRQC